MTGARAHRFACVLGIGLALTACESGESVTAMKPTYRLVDPEHRARMTFDLGSGPVVPGDTARSRGVRTSSFPIAEIASETRYVLAAPLSNVLLLAEKVEVDPDGSAATEVPLTARLAGSSRVLLAPQVKIGKSWKHLAPVAVRPSREGGKPTARLELGLPAELAGGEAELSVRGFALNWADTTRFETPPLRIPRGAKLEVGLGLLLPEWDQSGVEFSIEACDGGDCENLFTERLESERVSTGGWQDRTVSLESLAGRKVSLAFRAKRLDSSAGVFSFPLWANPTVYAPESRRARDVNVILLSLDTLRADHLPSYGYEHDTAPFIDEVFGAGGTTFEQCIAAASSTSPAHMSIFTGLYPSEHGVKAGLERLPDWIHPIAEPIRAAGIETAAITENAWLHTQHGFSRGFNTYSENRSANVMKPTGQVDVTFGGAKRWLARHHDKRFFLFLHTYQVHDPYAPPARYQQMFTEVAGQQVTEDSERYLRDLVAYNQEIRYADDELRSLFDELRRYGLDRNTVFLLTSDHGEAFLEHGFLRHSAHLYEEIVAVPLMAWGRGVEQGHRVSRLVGHVDIMPTVLDLVGVDPPNEMSGISLVPLLRGKTSAGGREPVYFTESWNKAAMGPKYTLVRFFPPAFGVRVGDRKLTRYRERVGVRYEYFDLARDPRETNNLFGTGDRHESALVERLERFEASAAETSARLLKAGGGTGRAAAPDLVGIDPAQEEKLRALGYLQ